MLVKIVFVLELRGHFHRCQERVVSHGRIQRLAHLCILAELRTNRLIEIVLNLLRLRGLRVTHKTLWTRVVRLRRRTQVATACEID